MQAEHCCHKLRFEADQLLKHSEQLHAQNQDMRLHLEQPREWLAQLETQAQKNEALRGQVAQLQQEVQERIQGCAKAQKIIVKFTEKAQQDNQVMDTLEQNIHKYQHDQQEQNKLIVKLQTAVQQTGQAKDAEHAQVGQELKLLRESVRQYQAD